MIPQQTHMRNSGLLWGQCKENDRNSCHSHWGCTKLFIRYVLVHSWLILYFDLTGSQGAQIFSYTFFPGIPVRAFLDEIRIWIGGLSELSFWCGWDSFRPLRTWTDERWKKGKFISPLPNYWDGIAVFCTQTGTYPQSFSGFQFFRLRFIQTKLYH